MSRRYSYSCVCINSHVRVSSVSDSNCHLSTIASVSFYVSSINRSGLGRHLKDKMWSGAAGKPGSRCSVGSVGVLSCSVLLDTIKSGWPCPLSGKTVPNSAQRSLWVKCE